MKSSNLEILFYEETPLGVLCLRRRKLLGKPSTKETWDLILIDVDHSPHEQLHEKNSSFYTREGVAQAKAHLAPGGILGIWSYAESSPFAEALRREFAEVLIHPVHFKNTLVDEDHTDWLFFREIFSLKIFSCTEQINKGIAATSYNIERIFNSAGAAWFKRYLFQSNAFPGRSGFSHTALRFCSSGSTWLKTEDNSLNVLSCRRKGIRQTLSAEFSSNFA